MVNIIDLLENRGFIDSVTSEEIKNFTNQPLKVYCGFDPTSDSLHLGNMVAIMGLAWFQKMGHTPVVIVGGATGMIGDPSGKSHERNLLDEQSLKKNLAGITENLERILIFGDQKPIILNNFDWFKGVTCIEYLRDIGKHFRLGPMLSKDSVKSRMETEEGMSYTEFSYQVLQGYDFLHLFDQHKVTLQIGGSDQWGNIVSGIDLIRKVRGDSAYGLTWPLLTKSDGQKFGKSEKGAIWLSPEKLSPYEFYQYLFRTSDADVIKLMRMLTFMEMEEINRYEKIMQQDDYIPNMAQKHLAEEVTRIVHGQGGLDKAIKVTAGAQPGLETILDADLLEEIGKDMPNFSFKKENILNVKLIDLMVNAQLQESKGAARRIIRNGGVYLNNVKITDENLSIEEKDLIDNRMLLLAIGKKNKVLIKLNEEK